MIKKLTKTTVAYTKEPDTGRYGGQRANRNCQKFYEKQD
jgi:hypothetical protein